jgi:phage shock protein E
MQNNLPTTWAALTLLVILALWLISPALAGSGDPVQAKQAWSMIDNGALLLDVRTKEEFAAGHLEGALNISWDDTNALAEAIGGDPERPVVVYCRSGNRSGKAKKALNKQGYNHIFNGTGLEALKATKP